MMLLKWGMLRKWRAGDPESFVLTMSKTAHYCLLAAPAAKRKAVAALTALACRFHAVHELRGSLPLQSGCIASERCAVLGHRHRSRVRLRLHQGPRPVVTRTR